MFKQIDSRGKRWSRSIDISLGSLIEKVSRFTPKETVIANFHKEKRFTTTLRLNSDERQFITSLSDHIGVSNQNLMNMMIRSAMNLSRDNEVSEIEMRVARFYDVFLQHRIPLSDIPKVLSNSDIVRSDLLTRKDLSKKLDDGIFDEVAELFNLNDNWFKEKKCSAHYKNKRWIDQVDTFLGSLDDKRKNNKIELFFVTNKDDYERLQDETFNQNAPYVGLLILNKCMQNGVKYVQYDVYDQESWGDKENRLNFKKLKQYIDRSGMRYGWCVYDDEVLTELYRGDGLIAGLGLSPVAIANIKF